MSDPTEPTLPSADRLPRTRRWLRRVGLITAAVLAAALLGELLLRLTGYSRSFVNPFRSFHRLDPRFGHIGRPHARGRFRRPEFDVEIVHNELGFRQAVHSRTAAETRHAVHVLGDSFAWGWGVGQGEVLTDRLSELLPGHRVLNYGVSASGTVHQHAIFSAFVADKLTSADTVLLVFFHNDFIDNVVGALHAEVRDGRVQPVEPPGTEPVGLGDVLKDHSYLVNMLAYTFDTWAVARRQSEAVDPVAEKKVLPHNSAHFMITKHYLTRFRDGCRAVGAKFAIAYIPDQAELGESHANSPTHHPAFRGALRAIADQLGVPLIDLKAGMLAFKRENGGSALTFPIDRHWNEAGHRAAARVIATWIEETERVR